MKQMYEEQDINQTKNKRQNQKDKTCNFEKLVNHVDLILSFHAIAVAEKKEERKKEILINKKTE